MPRIALVLGMLLVSACAQPVTPDSIVEESFSGSASERQLEELNRQGLPYEQYQKRRQRILGR
ncbi:hypothetical protein [Pseudomonas aeruginosa]|uniref:hypothetical protein n=1 Tax=Pseudomonas aeruginosa TaxID=287 RepID=UPI001571F488|nr:hypothetical protein [Pseudomonas aeruginosa]MCV4190024.1 hypothetical protein [Pseudomonas aeruginosa]NTS93678.1 hypothetical protein [Pseudomonas aeruginosa]